MNSAAGLGRMFIIPDVHVRASVQIINMGDKGPSETSWYLGTGINHLSSEVGLMALTACLLSVMVML